MLDIDVPLDARAIDEMNAIAPEDWFTPVRFRNAWSPSHPHTAIAGFDAVKASLVADWLTSAVPRKSILDLFCANGAFSIRCLQAGARSVVGVEASAGRVKCAQFLASRIGAGDRLRVIEGDVFEVLDGLSERFDVVLCLGGLYHVADPALLLKRIRAVVTGELILQTSHVLPWPGNWARFVVRRSEDARGDLPSVRPGRGAWHCTPECLRALLAHADFDVRDQRGPLRPERGRPRWWLARCTPR